MPYLQRVPLAGGDQGLTLGAGEEPEPTPLEALVNQKSRRVTRTIRKAASRPAKPAAAQSAVKKTSKGSGAVGSGLAARPLGEEEDDDEEDGDSLKGGFSDRDIEELFSDADEGEYQRRQPRVPATGAAAAGSGMQQQQKPIVKPFTMQGETVTPRPARRSPIRTEFNPDRQSVEGSSVAEGQAVSKQIADWAQSSRPPSRDAGRRARRSPLAGFSDEDDGDVGVGRSAARGQTARNGDTSKDSLLLPPSLQRPAAGERKSTSSRQSSFDGDDEEDK